MSSNHHHLLHLLLLFTTTLLSPPPPSLAASSSYADFVFAGCSQPTFTAGTPYQLNVDSILSSLANAAHFSSYSNFTSSSVSGLFQCRADLPISSCDTCVRSALAQLSALCSTAAGAAIQLSGCFLRYGNDSFLGKPDTSLLYKKCGASVPPNVAAGGGSVDVLGMRDAALAALGTGVGYRVGAAGYVQAVAQCVGDESEKECSECVAAAVGEVKRQCGYAVGGDVYLGKCYVRYWSNGVYTSSSRPDSAQEAGKTIAIIIGLLAGVALIIVFLSFIRRAGNSGKY